MTQTPVSKSTAPERWTLIAISALAYIIATGLHEHLGHTTACLLLGSKPLEVGAFYVDCNDATLSSLSIRLVALAGPLVSLLTGILSFSVLRRRPPRSSAAYYFVWLLGSIGFMSATGYLLFSGISGIGDFGTGPDGVFYQAAPEWLWRSALTLAGMASYMGVIYLAVGLINPRIAGLGRERIRAARLLANTSYLTGAAVSILIGLLNPHGLMIVAISAAASSLGATSGLLWMMQLLDRKLEVPGPGLSFPRSWRWIALSTSVTLIYALVLGPTLRP
jgi:hypothetical protein